MKLFQAGNGFDRNLDWDWEVRYVHETLGMVHQVHDFSAQVDVALSCYKLLCWNWGLIGWQNQCLHILYNSSCNKNNIHNM